MRMVIKMLVAFVIIFIMFYPASILMGRTTTEIESAGTNTLSPVRSSLLNNTTSFYRDVFAMVYSVSAIGIVITMIIAGITWRRDEYEYY